MRLFRKLASLRAVEALAGLLVLVVGAGATFYVADQIRSFGERDAEEAAQVRLSSIATVLEEGLTRYEDMLATVANGIASQSSLSQADFIGLVSRLKSLPGTTDIRLVLESRQTSWGDQKPGWLDLPLVRFPLRPSPGEAVHHYVIFQESVKGMVGLAGSDLVSARAHAEARRTARANAKPMSSPVDGSTGNLVVAAPVIGLLGQDDAGDFRAWVETVVEPSALLSGLLANAYHDGVAVRLTVDDTDVAEKPIADPQRSIAGKPINHLGASWRAGIALPRSLSTASTQPALLAVVAGSVLTLLVSGLVLVQAGSRRRALRLARTSTTDLVDEAARRERQAEKHRQRIAELELYSRQTATRLMKPLSALTTDLARTTDALISGRHPHAEEHLLSARRTATSSVRLLDDLLQLANLDDSSTDFVGVDLNQVIAEVVAKRERLWPGSSSYITIDPLPEVTGEANLFATVLERLLENALTYVSPGDTPWVHISADLVGEGWRGEQWRVEVTDRGIGVTEAARAQIFDVFVGDGSRREMSNHISLALCRKIVRMYGGDIGVESNVVGGSVFWFTVPTRSTVRRFRRVKHRTRLRFRTAGKVTTGETVDLSEGGTMYQSYSGSTPPSGLVGDAEFELDGSTITFRARVLPSRKDATPGEVRIEFITPSGSDLRILRRFIEGTLDEADVPNYPRTERDEETILKSNTIDLGRAGSKARHVRR